MYDGGWLNIVNIDVSLPKLGPPELKANAVVFEAGN